MRRTIKDNKDKYSMYLLLSTSFGMLIVNLQRDARKEFKGSTAWRTPQACAAKTTFLKFVA